MARTTALGKAMKGDKVTDKQAQGALGQAVDKIASLTKRAQKSKEAMAETGAMVVHTAETQGSLFLASMAEGYFGTDKLKIGSVDLRAPVGLLAQGYGLYEAMSGKGGGGHALALGNGVMGSWLASVAVQAGRTLAEKRGGQPQGQATQAQPQVSAAPVVTPAIQGPALIPEPLLQGPVREVLLTPEPAPAVAYDGEDDDELSGPRRGRGRRRGGRRRARRGPGGRRPNRFVRPPFDEDEGDEDDE
ncbi:MAG: hypothetical protein D6798_06100 [Deltaproteobacteria bacterium]|nr:MAG: hypothetical protein D6798_06100 [Deltaproteobacteria bacterium]